MAWRLGTIVVLAGAFLGPGGLQAADTVIEVLPIRNRPASDLVAPVQAMLGSEARVTSHDDKLIVNAPRQLMPQLKRLVAQLDVQPRSLWITVRQEGTLDARSRSAAAAVAAGPDGVAVGGHLSRKATTASGGDVHRVRALEGTPAWITVGESVPVTTTAVSPAPGGPAVVSGTTYQQADRGFWVVPRVSGSQVTLEIETARDEPGADGVVRTQGASTTVTGRLGEWISLGEIAQEGQAGASGVLSARRVTRRELGTIDVRVQDAP